MTQLTDQDKMPFGKHRGVAMEKIPARYFHWLWTEAGYSRKLDDPVGDYIWRNLKALQDEYFDGIWK